MRNTWSGSVRPIAFPSMVSIPNWLSTWPAPIHIAKTSLAASTCRSMGSKRRDLLVIETALREGAAVVVVLAGGYAINLQDTITIHSNTAKAAKEALDAVGWKN